MDEIMTKLFEEKFTDSAQIEKLFFSGKSAPDESKIPKESAQELAGEEETLKLYLDKLKKENFTLQSSIKAWKRTLEMKQEEFKEADVKLEEIYNEIWSEREKFCAKLDKFNEECGVLSEWWEMQIRFISETKEGFEGQERRQEVEKLEAEVEELKKEVKELQARKIVPEVEVFSTAEGVSVSPRNDSRKKESQLTPLLEGDEITEKCKGKRQFESDLFSLVDIEKVKMAKRRLRNSGFVRQKKPVKY